MFNFKIILNKNNSGFTLLEILIVVGLFTVAMITLGTFLISGYQTNTFGLHMSEAISQARKGIETAVKELREARYGDDGSYPIKLAESQALTFYSDMDKDAATEQVRYFLDSSTFKKGVTKPAGDPLEYLPANEIVTPLSLYVQNASQDIFTYYDGNNNMLLPPINITQIKLIRINLKTDVISSRAPAPYEIESYVQLRNLKDNL